MREAPAQLDRLDAQTQQMQRIAAESTAPDGAALASYFVLLRNPEPQARAYGLSFDRAEAMELVGSTLDELDSGRAQQMLGEMWDAMLDREYPSPAGTPRSGRGRMGVGANVPVGEVVIGPSPIDGSEGFTMVRWTKERGCPPVGTRVYAEKLHPANP